MVEKKNTTKSIVQKLSILPSEIHGMGIFAEKDIQKHDVVGLTHYCNDGWWYQTFPYGLYNHSSDSPNCRSLIWEEGTHAVDEFKHIYLIANRDIKKGEELVCDYRDVPFLEQPQDDWV